MEDHADELALAQAAARGEAAALREIEARVAPDIAAAARRVDPAPAFADEVRQATRVRLFVAPAAGATPRIADYAGRGPLRAWVGVAATRVALNLKRAAAAGPRAADLLAELVADETDPELRHLRSTYRAEFRAALADALAALAGRERALLRLCYVDGLRAPQLARLYGVHETTALRWLAAAAQAVGDGARRRLVDRLALSPATVDSVARMILSHLDLSIARILGDPAR